MVSRSAAAATASARRAAAAAAAARRDRVVAAGAAGAAAAGAGGRGGRAREDEGAVVAAAATAAAGASLRLLARPRAAGWRRRARLVVVLLVLLAALRRLLLLLLLLVQLLLLLLQVADQHIAALLQLSRRARLDEPVKAELPRAPDLAPDRVPVAVADAIHQDDKEAILLLRERPVLVARHHLQRRPRVLARLLRLAHLAAHDLGEARRALQPILAAFDPLDAARVVAQLLAALQPHLPVPAHVRDVLLRQLRRLGADGGRVRAAVLLGGVEQDTHVAALPVAEALGEQPRLLRLLLLRELQRLHLLLDLDAAQRAGHRVLLLNDLVGGLDGLGVVHAVALARRHQVAHAVLPQLPLSRQCLAQLALQLAPADEVLVLQVDDLVHALLVEELVVRHGRRADEARALAAAVARGVERLAEIGIDVVVLLALALRQRDERPTGVEAAARLLLVAPVLALVLEDGRVVAAVQREVHEVVLHVGLDLLRHRRGALLAVAQDGVDVGVGYRRLRGPEHLISAEPHHGHQLALAEARVLLHEAPLLDDDGVEVQLTLRALDDLLLHSLLRDEAEHAHLLLLPDAVRAIHGLQVHLRVPVAVVEDDDVGRGEVDAEPAGARGQQEHEAVALVLRVAVDGLLPQVARDGTVQALVHVAAEAQVLLERVEHLDELREDEHAVALRLELRQQLVQQHELAGALDEAHRALLLRLERDGVHLLHARDQVRVVAALAQLHDDVHQRRRVLGGRARHQHARVLLVDGAVVLLLDRRQLHLDDGLLLGRQARLHVLLQAPQQVRLDRLVQLRHLLLRLQVAELLREALRVVEAPRLEEVHQRPQLERVVLHGRARQQHRVLALEVRQLRRQRGLGVLQPVRLVHHQHMPLDAVQELAVA
mmetsp:Transcript_16565/g.57911  ORF Transcript_16565/g.57911 Transcript_16565/m.57911 type:complete len:886 (+) Transcript_16565:420-3077(+)